MMRNCIFISLLLNLIILSNCNGDPPKLRLRRKSVAVDEGVKNNRLLLEGKVQWSDIIKKFGLKENTNPVLLQISNQKTIDCDGEIVSVDINNLKPVSVYSSGAHCVHDDIDGYCHTGKTTTYTGSTSDDKQYIVTFDSKLNVRTVDYKECHMEKIFPGLMAKIYEDDTVDIENEGDIFQDGDESVHDQKRNLYSNLMEKYGNNTNGRSLESDDTPYCPVFRTANIAIAFDTTFCNNEGGYDQAVTEVQNIVARASLSFESQGVCVKLAIKHIDGHCDLSTDPYHIGLETNDIGCGNPGLIQYFKTHVLETPELRDADSAHLFYHRTLTLSKRTRGCANFFRVCRSAVGVNDMSFNQDEQKRAYLFAHEMGHNFGMNHHGHEGSRKSIMKGVPSNGQHYWHPEDIEDFNFVLAQVSLSCLVDETNPASTPTPLPTSSPTMPPTPSPITLPTPSPTPLPTSSPASSPTPLPAPLPTPLPTSSPTTPPTSSPTYSPTLLPTSSPTSSPTMPPTSLPTLSHTPLPTSSPTMPPTSSPISLPTPSPTLSPTAKHTPSITPLRTCETFLIETFESGWSNERTKTFDAFGKILGRWYLDKNNSNTGSSKLFEVSTLADEIIITFKFFEFDKWEKDDNANVFINDKRIVLGPFRNNNNKKNKKERKKGGNVDGILWDIVSDENKYQIAGKNRQFDQIHLVTIIVPKNMYADSGKIKLEFTTDFHRTDKNENDKESAGISDFVMEACEFDK